MHNMNWPGSILMATGLSNLIQRPQDFSVNPQNKEMYCQGWGVSVSYSEALRWLQMAMNNGDEYAQFYLGMMYLTGTGVQQNSSTAVNYILPNATRGDASAQYYLGAAYEDLNALKEAEKWYEKAAKQNYNEGDENAKKALERVRFHIKYGSK